VRPAHEILFCYFLNSCDSSSYCFFYSCTHTHTRTQARRRDDDISIVTSGFALRLEENPSSSDSSSPTFIIASASLSFGGIGPCTRTAPLTEAHLVGKAFGPKAFEDAYEVLAKDIDMAPNAPGGQVCALCLVCMCCVCLQCSVMVNIDGGGVSAVCLQCVPILLRIDFTPLFSFLIPISLVSTPLYPLFFSSYPLFRLLPSHLPHLTLPLLSSLISVLPLPTSYPFFSLFPPLQVEYRRSLCSSFLFKFYLHVADALVRRGTPGLEAAEAPTGTSVRRRLREQMSLSPNHHISKRKAVSTVHKKFSGRVLYQAIILSPCFTQKNVETPTLLHSLCTFFLALIVVIHLLTICRTSI
jgi:hypothetical protein